MPDLGHDLQFGCFLTPTHADPGRLVAAARAAERAGLDLVTVQDHPYQPSYLDTWTLLAHLGGATERVRLAGNVLNLPLRPPAMLAKAVASLDLLTGGRVELGLGAGAFWDAIAAMGGRRLAPGEAVDALSEAIDVIRGVWDAGAPRKLTHEGRHYPLTGTPRGPAPAHAVGIWLGAYGPRMLRLTGAKADGWLPSLGRMSPAEIAAANARIDDAAAEAGRSPADIRRLANITGRFGPATDALLVGPPDQWIDGLTMLALEHGFSTFVLLGDDVGDYERVAAEVAPAVRELVAAERA